MKKITAIQAQSRLRKHLGTRVNIFLDGSFAFAIDAEVAREANLRIGKYLQPEEVEALEAEDGAAKALALAINFLGYRARSSHEIRERLARDENWSDETIARVLEKLTALNLVSDRAFAQAWIESRSRSKPRGSRALRQELRQKGVGREDIDAALQETVPDDATEIENALAALQSKARQWERLEGREREQKMLGFLGRRGFNFGVARSAVKKLDEPDEDD
jgi:regulatory protein